MLPLQYQYMHCYSISTAYNSVIRDTSVQLAAGSTPNTDLCSIRAASCGESYL